MKSSIESLIWMCIVMVYTLILDVAYVAGIVHFIKYGKDWLVTVVFILAFTVLTGMWNFVSIRALLDAIKTYKTDK